MVSDGIAKQTSRSDRADLNRLIWAFVVSLVLHLGVYGGYEGGKKLGLWERLRLPPWLQPTRLAELLKKPDPKTQSQDIPLVFVEVNPVAAVAEPPKDAKFYSDKNSRAANPDPAEAAVPKIEGNQEQIVKTEDVPREKFTPLQPALPAQPAKEEKPAEKPKPPEKPGDLAVGKPQTKPPETGEAKQTRPRTLAKAREQNRIPGEKMRQEGGVRNRLEISSLDARATPFGAYDHALIEAISQRWFHLLDEREYASDSRGKVVVQFRLFQDGTVKIMAVAENTTASEVLGIICRKAIEDPAPFPSWPDDMKRMLGDTRSIQFTFYYN